MNRKEVAQLVTIANSNFPTSQERDMKPTLLLWEKALSDIPYDIAEKALLKVLSTSKFFPTLAEIREASVQLTQPRSMDAIEAWGMIVQAIRKYGMYDQVKAMESFPPEVAEMVRRFTWRELCLNENPDTLRAQFRMAWETQSKREREMSVLPSNVREMIESVSGNMNMNGDRRLK